MSFSDVLASKCNNGSPEEAKIATKTENSRNKQKLNFQAVQESSQDEEGWGEESATLKDRGSWEDIWEDTSPEIRRNKSALPLFKVKCLLDNL